MENKTYNSNPFYDNPYTREPVKKRLERAKQNVERKKEEMRRAEEAKQAWINASKELARALGEGTNNKVIVVKGDELYEVLKKLYEGGEENDNM